MQSILIAILASYSVAVIVSEYDGPLDIFYNLRRSRLSALFSCSVCLGVYVSIVFSMALSVGLVGCFAVIGGVTLLARNT